MQTLILDIQKVYKELGDSISGWRKLLGLTAAQVADRADIAKSTYSKIENGNMNVNATALLGVLRSLGLLNKVAEAVDPYNSDLGRIRADQQLPKRIRRKKATR
jgi:transcriptional regulator with XRE-family HTH domain